MIYLEKLPAAFVFSEKCDEVHLFKTAKYSEFIPLKLHDCSDTIFRNTRPVLESFSLPIY